MKNFQLLPLILLGAILWSGCSNVTFTDPLPLNRRDLDHFPKKWQGTWSDGEDLTITIAPSYFVDSDSEEKVTLGEQALLRRFHGYLVLNQMGDDGAHWSVLLGRRWKDEIKIWNFDEENAEAVAVWRQVLADANAFEEASKLSGKTTYVLSPENNAAFRKLITQGGLTRSYTLRRATP